MSMWQQLFSWRFLVMAKVLDIGEALGDHQAISQ
jgi:hypothetical protein